MTILVLSSHTQSLFWFRLDMMKAFLNKDAKVFAVGSEDEALWKDKFLNEGIEYRAIPVSRNGLNIFEDLRTFRAIRRLIREVKPDKIFTYQAKTIVYGSLAAGKDIEIYPLVAGLGSVFRGTGLKNKIIKYILRLQYLMAFKRARTVIFQNTDDRDSLIAQGIIKEDKTAIIHGSGVNIMKFTPTPLPKDNAILFIGRLIADKGVNEYLALAQRLHNKNKNIRCLLVGPYDTNPSTLKPEDLQPFISSGVIEYFGEQKDVRPFLSQCTVYVLPSYHEGTPKTVLEAMAMGRPVVTTDAPGCRETVVNGENGFLVSVKNVDELESAVNKILDDPSLCEKFGANSRILAENKFDVDKVNSSILEIMKL